MKIQIDHTNYEAFYLDYLEGNLSGEALVAFEDFMSENPDLTIDEEELPTLTPTSESYDALEKMALKQGIDTQDLNEDTYEFFLIAREEGLLTPDQQAHLNHWLEANAHYRQDANLFALTKFEADETVVYAHKSALKQPVAARVIPMWFTGVAIAAGLALLFTIGINTQDHTQQNGVQTAGNTTKTEQVTTGNTIDTTRVQEQTNSQSGSTIEQSGQTTTGTSTNTDKTPVVRPKKSNDSPKPVRQRNILLQETVMASLEKRSANWNSTSDKTIQPRTFESSKTIVTEEQTNTDMAWICVKEMTNPIEPVTNKLSSTFNTPVDFRTAKASKKKGGGFFLKIGKLEVSHQSASLY